MKTEEQKSGWVTCRFGDIARVRNGYAFKSAWFKKQKTSVDDVPLVRQSQLRGLVVDLEDAVYLPRQYLDEYESYIILDGDVLIGMSGSIGKVCTYKNDKPALQNQRTGKIEPLGGSKIDARFFGLYLSSVENELIKFSKGMGVQNISSKDIEGLSLNLPPYNEQKRIVTKVEELFSELDAGIQNLRISQEKLRIYRSAILSSIFRKLMSEVPARPLSELIGPIQQGWSPRCDLRRGPRLNEWAIIKTTAVQPMRYRGEECKPIPHQLKARPDIEIKPGDMLMTRKGPRQRTGVTCLVRNTRAQSMVCDTVYRFRCNEHIVVPTYLELILNAPSVLSEIDTKKSGIDDSGVSLTHQKIQSILLPVPNQKYDQEAIVEEVENKFSVIEKMESDIETQLTSSDALRQSILHHAFSGKLVAQDPNDEPASVLLERIKAEKAEKENGKKKNGKRKAA